MEPTYGWVGALRKQTFRQQFLCTHPRSFKTVLLLQAPVGIDAHGFSYRDIADRAHPTPAGPEGEAVARGANHPTRRSLMLNTLRVLQALLFIRHEGGSMGRPMGLEM